MTESNAVAKFKQELHHALEIFYPGWHKKPRLTSYDLLEANPDTLHTWTSKSGSLPKQRKFTQFLESATQFSLDVKQQLEALFDAALSAQEKGAKESNSEHSGGSQLPNRNTVFVGRSMEFRELFEMLCSANSPTILTLFGLGGMGKTAIATELATQALKQKVFARVVWVKGRGEYFENGKIWIDPIEQVSVASILNEVAQVLGLPDLTKWSLGDLSSELTSVLASQRTLLVLDNFEAVPEKNAIIQTLYPIFHGIGRILITTREVINHFDQYNHKIWAMNEMDSLAFLKAEPKDNNVKRIIDSAEETQLGALYEATGGLPLAMRLVVGQLFSMTLEDVLAYLKEARSTHTSDSDANYQFYFFIYHASWRQLDPTSRVLLLSMSLFTPNSGDRISRIRQVFRENLSKAQERFGITVTGDEFQHASETLIRMSLIDKLGSLGQENLAIHTITRHFVQGEIVKLWG